MQFSRAAASVSECIIRNPVEASTTMSYDTAIQSMARDYARLRLKRTQTQDLIAFQPDDFIEFQTDEARNSDKRHDAWFYPDVPWGAPPSWDKRTKGKMFLRVWDVITFIACIYVAIMVPYISGGLFCPMLFRPLCGVQN